MRNLLFIAAVLIGIFAIAYGAWLIYAPLALIFVGVTILAGTYIVAYLQAGGRT